MQNKKFENDVVDFFLHEVSGNLWPYLYGDPLDDNDLVKGGILYNTMLETEKDYYLYEFEAELFQSKGKAITSLLPSNATFIELGPGSEQSLRLKTLELLKNCKDLKGYIGIDISQSFLDKGLEVIRSEFPNILLQGIQQDFTQLESFPAFENSVIFFKGSTIANLKKDEVPVFIEKIRSLAAKNHYLVLVHDANQDEASLMSAYDNVGVAKFMENIMCRVQRDVIPELDCQAFRYKPEWHSSSFDLKHVLIATKDQEFNFKEKIVKITQGQKFHTLSSFKYPTEEFKKMLILTGYKPIDVFLDSSERMAAHVFQG